MADLAQKASAAGREWWHVGQHTSGVANARVVRYGFLKWWNDQPVSETKGHSKSYMEKQFRYGWKRAKQGPPRIPNGRLVPARIRHNRRTYPGKVKRVGGRIKIFVTPQVARKINPRNQHPGDYKDSVLAQVGHLTHRAKSVKEARKWIKGMYSRGLAFGRTAIIWKYDGKTGTTKKVFEKSY